MVKFGKKFFFDASYTKKARKRLILGFIILIIIIVILIIVFSNMKKKKKVNVVNNNILIRDEIISEVNAPFPEKASYFEKLSNIDINSIDIKYVDEIPKNVNVDNCTDEEKLKINDILDNTSTESLDNYSCAYYVPKELGTYNVEITINKKVYNSKLVISDKTEPELVLKDAEIQYGTEYTIETFVESCIDNNDDKCILNYYYNSFDSNSSDIIDYAKYSEPGTYQVKIVASDNSGNMTKPQTATLTIAPKEPDKFLVTFDSAGGTEINGEYIIDGEKVAKPANPTRNGYTFDGWLLNGKKYDFNTPVTSEITLVASWKEKASTPVTPKPKTPVSGGCEYGDKSYDTNKFIITVYADANSKCASSLSEFETLVNGPATTNAASKDAKRLASETDTSTLTYGFETRGVLNKKGTGIVGYQITVTIQQTVNGVKTEVVRYVLDGNGKRHFTLNLLNLPE